MDGKLANALHWGPTQWQLSLSTVVLGGREARGGGGELWVRLGVDWATSLKYNDPWDRSRPTFPTSLCPHYTLPCSWFGQYLCPDVWVKKFSFKHWCKVSIFKIWRIILFHKFHVFRSLLSFPAVPEPLGSKTGHWVHPPMDKDTKLGLVIPRGERSWV